MEQAGRGNPANIKRIPTSRDENGKGVYILFDGSMPVYVGKGNIRTRITKAPRGRKKQLWDRFSWFAVNNQRMMHDIEVLMIKMLPHYLRSLNQQGGHFAKSKKAHDAEDVAISITARTTPKKAPQPREMI